MIQSPRDRLYSIWFAHWSPSKGNHACRCGAEWHSRGSRGIIMASARLMFSQCGNLHLLADTKQVPNQQPSFASLLTASNASALSFCPLFPTLHLFTKYPFPSPSLTLP